ncbi:MAG: TlpA disulfide reductase family protein [Acidobacteriota bacterium]
MIDPKAESLATDSKAQPSSPMRHSPVRRSRVHHWARLLVLSCCVMLVACGAAPVESIDPEARRAAPEVELRDLVSGDVTSLEGYRGKVVLLDFWATWCGPCKIQQRILDELHEEIDAEGVAFLAINTGEEDDEVRRYLQRTPFPYPNLMDSEGVAAARFRVTGLPTVLVLDEEGRIAYDRVGVTDKDTLRSILEQELGEAEPAG